jgi:hypothetical protein
VGNTVNPKLRDRLGKVLALLTSPEDGERLAAAARFTAILDAHGVHPSEVMNGGPVLSEEAMSRIYAEGYQRGLTDGRQQVRPERDWTPSGGSAEAGSDAERIQMILKVAAENTNLLTQWENDWVNSVGERFEQYGARFYVSDKMWAIFDRLETKFRRSGVS